MKTIRKFSGFILSLIVTATFFNCNIQPLAAQTRAQDSLALVEFYNSTNGASWKYKGNWLTANPISSWYGITVSGNRVTRIKIQNNNITGTISPSIGSLDGLHYIDLTGNPFTGSIPDTIGKLLNLDTLILSSGYFTGTFPASFCNLTNLIVLDISNNQLSGDIPTAIGNLINLKKLLLGANQFTGTIPTGTGNLSNLIELYLSWNKLSGNIPASLGNLSNLTSLKLTSNLLTGSIPSELSNLTNLIYLDLSNNQLSGSIPPGLGNLSNLQSFWLSYNKLTGSIPSELGNLTGLLELYLHNNLLTGSIPSQIGSLSNLQILYLASNQLSGSIPSELGNLSSLKILSLNNNNLTGTIPPELGNLSLLTSLLLSDNQLTGSVPSELGNLVKLLQLYLANNQFTGSVPSELGNLVKLSQLHLANNQFTGNIPVSIANATDIQEVDVRDNKFENFPDLSSLNNLSFLRMENNKFTFEDIEPNAGTTKTIFTYSPQDSIGNKLDTTVKLGVKLSFTVSAKGQHTSYIWMKNGIYIAGATDSTFTINSSNFSDSGSYICRITNTVVTGLTLYSLPKIVHIEPTPLQKDSLVLVDLYNSTLGFNWLNNSNWLTGPIATWHGITVTGDRVTNINLSNNNLFDSVPSSIINLTNLQTLYLNGNKLYYVPDLSSLSGLTELKIENNNLTFDDIVPNIGVPSSSFTYSPQDSVGNMMATTIYLESRLDLSASVNGASLSYQWQKDGVDIDAATANTYSIVSAAFNSSGVYTCNINSSIATALTLHQRSILVTVEYSPLQIDSLALIALYQSTNGPNWTNKTNWLTSNPISKWYGITVIGSRVTTINLRNNSLSGQLPVELKDLTALQGLELGDNNLSGNIPPEIGSMSSLKYLHLYSNQFSGNIPSELGNLSQLEDMYLAGNQLTDSIPSSLGKLKKLATLNVQYNSLKYIPPQIGDLTGLVILALDRNQFSGALPDELGNIPNLFSLSAGFNNFTSIPASIGNLKNLQTLGLYHNNLSGTVPGELSNLTNLTSLYLEYNNFTAIASEIGNLPKLIYFNIDHNQLSAIPSEIGNMSSLHYLEIQNNNITSIPSTLGNLTGLLGLSLDSNKLSTIPPEIGNISGLQGISISHNQLTSVPDEIGGLSQLVGLDLSYNLLTGLPDPVGITGSCWVAVNNNKLTFEDLEKYSVKIPIARFTYNPQDSTGIKTDTIVYEGSRGILSVSVGGTANHYQWTKNGVNVQNSDNDSLIFDYINKNDSGTYSCNITNTNLYYLTLYNRPIHVKVIDTLAPAVPKNLAAFTGSKKITLKWRANTEPDFLRYRIYGGPSPNPTVLIDSTTGGKSDTIKTIVGLTNGTTYYYRITSVDNLGNQSNFSNEVSIAPVSIVLTEYNKKSVDFDRVHLGQTSSAVVIITNKGTDTLKVTIIGSSNSVFTANQISQNILSGQSYEETIEFTPTSLGLVSALITITSNAFSEIDTITVSGYGYGTSITSYSAKTIDFGKVHLDILIDTVVTITNTGNDTLKITNINTSNTVFDVKPILSFIAPGQSYNDTIRFAPTDLGLVSALIIITSNASTIKDTVRVSGYGYGTSFALYSETTYDFGKVQLPQNREKIIAITNTGNDTLKITSITSSHSLFTMNFTSQIVLPGNSFNLTIRFSASKLVSATALIIVYSNAPSIRDTLRFSGSSYGIPMLNFIPNNIWCGNVKIGQSYKTKVTLSNIGNDTLRIDSITFTNPQYVLNTVLLAIPPGGSISDTVQFVPVSLGTQSSTIIIASNALSLRDTIYASGYGYGEGKLSYNKYIDFGRVLLDHRKDSVIEIANIGNDTFRIQSIAGDNRLRLVPPGESIKDTLSFNPWRLGSESGMIFIYSNGNETVDTIYIKGIGYEFAAFSTDPAQLGFGDVQIGSYLDKVLTYQNNGKDTLRITDIISTNEVFVIDKQEINLTLAPTWFYGAVVRFTPLLSGLVTGNLIFISNSPSSPDTVAITGTGLGDVNISQTNSGRLMSQNYPNPFNSSTTIAFHVPSKTFVSLKIYNIDGKEVVTLYSGELFEGIHKLKWNAENFAAGIYSYRLQIGQNSEVKNLVLIK